MLVFGCLQSSQQPLLRGSDSAGVNAVVPGLRVDAATGTAYAVLLLRMPEAALTTSEVIGMCRVLDFSTATEARTCHNVSIYREISYLDCEPLVYLHVLHVCPRLLGEGARAFFEYGEQISKEEKQTLPCQPRPFCRPSLRASHVYCRIIR